MTSVVGSQASAADAPEQRAGTSPLLQRIHREVGLAAVSTELRISTLGLPVELRSAIDRGATLLKAQTLAA
jgi:hypothetical protein